MAWLDAGFFCFCARRRVGRWGRRGAGAGGAGGAGGGGGVRPGPPRPRAGGAPPLPPHLRRRECDGEFPQSPPKREKSPSLNVSRDLIRVASRRSLAGAGGDGGAGGRRRGGGAGPVRGKFRRTEPGDRLRLLRVVQKVRPLFSSPLFSIEFC